MVKFFARLGSVGFLEILGCRLLYIQNYMQYRAIIFTVMAIVIVMYITCETIIESKQLDCITDYQIHKDETGASVEDFFECLEELTKETDKKKENE